MFSAIENSESTDQTISTHDLAIDLEINEVNRIVQELSFNNEAIKWLPKIYHYHVLADKVITDLSTQNETLKKLVLNELNSNHKN
jgi:hypothetical protein